MRRILAPLATLGVLLAVLGCHHTAGICDCDQGHCPCVYPPYGPGQGAHAVVTPAPAETIKTEPAKVEPLKVMPKTEGR